MSNYLEAQRWLRSMAGRYPYQAVCDAREPSWSGSGCVSRVTGFNRVTWAFQFAEMRDLFVAEVPSAEKVGKR